MKFDQSTNYYQKFIDCLKKDEPFSFSRFNDGELGLIFEVENVVSTIKRRWGNEIEEESLKLKNIFHSKIDYYLGICRGYLINKIELIENNVHRDTKVISSGIFHYLSKDDFLDFLELLKTKNTLLVGPDYLSEMNFHKFHIETPIEFVWKDVDELKLKILEKIETERNLVIVYAASIATKLLIDSIYKISGQSITQIDLGSCLDPYCGVHSRTGHKAFMDENNIEIKKIIRRK